MILISHRGNIDGPEKEFENDPKRIDFCIDLDFCVEIDFRIKDKKLYLGHDEAQYEIDEDWLIKRKNHLWVHCKERESFEYALKMRKLNCFWHNVDDYTMTSFGYVWAYPGKECCGSLCVAVMPEPHWSIEEFTRMPFIGICSDFAQDIRNHINTK
jgi:hypothetical protein